MNHPLDYVEVALIAFALTILVSVATARLEQRFPELKTNVPAWARTLLRKLRKRVGE